MKNWKKTWKKGKNIKKIEVQVTTLADRNVTLKVLFVLTQVSNISNPQAYFYGI